MSDKSNVEAFRTEIQRKIRNLLTEFGKGEISSEQFNILYERYSNQLIMANQVIDGTSLTTTNDMPTIAIREATTGKAIGMGIYHHRSGTIVETLGNFDIPPQLLSPVLNELSHKMDAREFIEPVIRRLDERSGVWLAFIAREFTTAITIFHHEPAKQQIREMERLLHDFELANQRFLDKYDVDPAQLASPFIGFVRKKLK